MSNSVLDSEDSFTLSYLVNHVFCPPKLPHGNDHAVRHDCSLVGAITMVAHRYGVYIDQANMSHWQKIPRMLDNLRAVIQFQHLDRSQTVSQFTGMKAGDILAYLIRAQNVAVVFRKQRDATIFESFEVSPKAENVMTTQGKLICSYPGPAIAIPNDLFHDGNFLSELINFLVHMNDDILPDAAATTQKAHSTILETRDTTHPRYITELLTGILRSVGRPADIVRISKRVGDDVVWNNSKLPWRRSSLWLLIRVVLQTTLDWSPLGRIAYKQFMLFFLCCLGKEKVSTSLSNDCLQFMSAKISRRLHKLGASVPGWLSQIVLDTCTSIRSTLEKRWTQIQAAQRVSPLWSPSELNLSEDIRLSLLCSKDYLRSCLVNHHIDALDTQFTPELHRRGGLDDFLSSDGAFFEERYRSEPHVTLYDVEWAVQEGIDGWVDRVKDNEAACVELELLANRYSTNALKTYGNNPELLSIMLLTTIELWIALDKMAIRDIPMLAEYSPEVPTNLLEELLLRKGPSLARLRLAHDYLSRRHTESKRGWSVFSPIVTADTFAVRYHRGSVSLQQLKGQIEVAAQRDVEKKSAELERANAHHADLKQKCINTDHSSAVTQDGREFHPKKCTKCRLEKKLNRMEIAIYEWPLPAEQIRAETVVFELGCPTSFNMWRNATFHLLVDLCSPSLKPKDPYIKLDRYGALRPYLIEHPRSRITLGSDTKPFVVTHYGKVSIPAAQKRVCVNNGLKFDGFDSQARIPVSEALGRTNISGYCTYQLQSGPYQNLQQYLDTTSHMSNEVLANQIDCNKDISLHEFVAFGHLRCGGSLQWLNVLRELRSRSLTFRRPEVHFLIAQAVSQAGPLTNSGWVWHQEICQPSFGMALIAELEKVLGDVKANWLEGVTMDTISFLLSRLLASNPDQTVSQKAFELLRVVRERVFSWVIDLSSKLIGTSEDEEVRGLLRDTAAICRSTFNVDPAMLQELLCSDDDVKVLLSCAIFIHDNTPGKVTSLSMHSQLLLERDRRLSLALETVLSYTIRTHAGNRGIDLAVRKAWPLYRPGSKWCPLQYPDSRWITCKTAPTANQCSQTVHFNLLDGSLLVDGKPLGRLPHAIMRHPLYIHIFGTRVLNVSPADRPGMDFLARDMISNHRVYFSLRNDNLVIETVSGSTTSRLIPPEKFTGDLPAVLISGHAHWLNVSEATPILEIRPLDKLWESSSDNWRINCTPGRYHMHRGRELLIDIRSQSWAMVSSLLEPLDTPQNLLVSLAPKDQDQPLPALQLSVCLPRYGLSFYVDEDGDLQSHNIRDMVYDKNQSIGTMFGLVNQLVLRPKSGDVDAAEFIPRCVLIPEGDVSFELDDHHVRVEIDTQGPPRMTYQAYKVDTDLGCLAGNVSLTNKLYCAYLHALTGGCSTDPLTSRSGTEEALSLLRSPNCWSIMRFSPRDAELLGLIASMCPSRSWYPEQLRCMQQVEWLDLPANAQHHELYIVATGIKEHYERVQSFHDSPTDLFQSFPSREDHLLKRSALRAACLLPAESSSELFWPGDFDVRYRARDVIDSATGEHRAYTAAITVRHRATNSVASKCINRLMKSWNESVVHGTAPLSFQYDRSWLNPDLASIWLEAYNLLRKGEGKWCQLLFTLPAMAYATPQTSELVPAFVAFATEPQFCLEDPPDYDLYHLSEGYRPSPTVLHDYISNCVYPFERSPESTELAKPGESFNDLRRRQLKLYSSRRDSDADATVQRLLDTWPWETSQCLLDRDRYDVENLTSNVQSLFLRCYRNVQLREHLTRVQKILKGIPSQAVPALNLQYSFLPSENIPSRISWSLSMNQLLLVRPVPSLRAHGNLPQYAAKVSNTPIPSASSLNQLIDVVVADATNPFHLRYASALRTSARSLGTEIPLAARGTTKGPTTEVLTAHYSHCKTRYVQALDYLRQSLGPRSNSERSLRLSGQWPRVTAHTLFRLLASNSLVVLSNGWKKSLIRLALLLLELQRARRLLRLQLDDRHEEFRRELENEGCDGWAAEEHPDWLLIQLQGNFLIRPVQVDVANEMISPRSGRNTAMQLNMGEGKSSVIVPISAAALADGDQVVRVIVPKALTSQMFQLLVDRLGGLANRRIYFLPFSRSVKANPEQIVTLREIMEECMRNHGILVVQPEHVLSLKLVTVEKQLSRVKGEEGPALLLDLERWLHSRSRDILDESDEILHVRYELVYTIGLQRHMEGFPERWTTTQQILGLVNKCAPSLRRSFPLGVECERGPPGSFPHLRILHENAGQKLISRIVQYIMDGDLPDISFGQLHPDVKDAIRSFILYERITHRRLQLVKEYALGSPLWSGLLLLRGLLATGILLFAFRDRRWRVDYGLAPPRTMLAVPYRAKDVPAQRAEFGHPDVAIILTCLSYYYGGLDEEQLKASFEILLKQDDPTVDYDLWVRECSAVPDDLKALSGINVKSSEQWRNHLLPLFSRNKATIDFYLSRIVFPREAKEFPLKLSCSGWDLAEKRDRLLTGFSGTNDGQYLLPLDITQHDPVHQRGTNAKVLAYLLQPENNHYMCTTYPGGTRRRTAREFLDVLAAQKPAIHVLLDVGAQMLDLQNRELAEAWLAVSPNSSAAIYFSEDDELTVLTRDGGTQLLLSSPFAQQLDQCVVYLDDAHTRGTDINFPSGFRAAVTLGPGVTKDRLAQGCMRMRKLGQGHSIMFFGPFEVDRRIRLVAGKSPSSDISTMDILKWAIRETCDEIQQRAPHWAQQGMNHASRYDAWSSFSRGMLGVDELSAKWLQPEAKKLEDLYAPRKSSNPVDLGNAAIRRRCTELEAGALSPMREVSMDEEQEREVIHEAEREREMERPPRVPPATHVLHPDVVAFVRTGVIPKDSKAFRPPFQTLEKTSAATKEAHVWSPSVLVTTDFEKTVNSSGKVDYYLRPVQWIVSGSKGSKDVLVVFSPFEVDRLLPDIRSSKYVHLHLYTPRVTKAMQSCDDLTLYSVPPTWWTAPPLLMDQLNVFAGQLYLKNYETYIRLCRFLSVCAADPEEEVEVGSDGSIAPSDRPLERILRSWSGSMHTFHTSPMDSIKILIGLRRKGVQFVATHMGMLVDGRVLSESDFEVNDNVRDHWEEEMGDE